MTKFEKNKHYKIGKIKANSDTSYNVEFMKSAIALSGAKLIETASTFEEWIETDSHRFKAGDNIVIAEQLEDGTYKFIREHTVPKIDFQYDPNEPGLSDNAPDYFAFQDRLAERSFSRSQNQTANEVINVLKEQIAVLQQENKDLKSQLDNQRLARENGLSDNLLAKFSLENEKERSQWRESILNKEIEELKHRLSQLETENKGLSDNAQTNALKILEYGNMLMETPIGKGLQSLIMSKIPGMNSQPQAQIQMQTGQIPTGQQGQPQQQQTISNEDIYNDPQGY